MDITRIRIADVIEDLFCIIDEPRRYRNRDYRTLLMVREPRRGGSDRIFNLLELRNRAVRQRLAFRYAEAMSKPAQGFVERCLDNVSFDWANASSTARHLVISCEKSGKTPYGMALWAMRNCQGEVRTLEGMGSVRASFSHPDDFLLATLQFS